MEITKELVQKVLDIVSVGLVQGKGKPIPGQMCIEAAVCYAMGLPHGDDPPCVGAKVRRFKITLNDCDWSSNQARANGMLALSIAQLGSNEIDQNAFNRIVSRETIRLILPIAMRNAAKKNPKYADKLEEAAKLCEEEPTRESALKARRIACIFYTTRDAAYVAGHAAYAYMDIAAAAADDDDAYAAAAAANTAANAADDAYAAANTAANAAAAAAAAVDDAYAAANTAANAAYTAHTDDNPDSILELSAKIGLEALKELNSPGCKYLNLIKS